MPIPSSKTAQATSEGRSNQVSLPSGRAGPSSNGDSAHARVAEIFAHQRGGEAFAALHRALSSYGVRRLTIATLDSTEASPVRFEYHADLAEAAPEPMDAQTLALALGCQRLTTLPTIEPIRRASNGASSSLGRLAHALVAPLWCGGRHVGFGVVQSETDFAPAAVAEIATSATLIAQHLTLMRDETHRDIQSRSL